MEVSQEMQKSAGLKLVALLSFVIGICFIMALALLFNLGNVVLKVNDMTEIAELSASLALGTLAVGTVFLALGIVTYGGRPYGWFTKMVVSLLFIAYGDLALASITNMRKMALATLLAIYLLLPGVRKYFGIRPIEQERAI